MENQQNQIQSISQEENFRQTSKLEKMENLKLVIFCDSKYPPRFLKLLLHLIKPYLTVNAYTYFHSDSQTVPTELLTFCSEFYQQHGIQKTADINIAIIWKDIGVDPHLHISTTHNIIGEINIARYLNRFIESRVPHLLCYESEGPIYANRIDLLLERIHAALHSGVRCNIRKKSRYVTGDNISIVDLILESRK